jgi:hypothetical protein
MAGAWRWRGGVAARGERGDETMARAFKRWVRLIGGPSPLLIYSDFPKLQLQNSQTRSSGCPKMVKIFEVIKKITTNNFPLWVLFQILLYCML